MYQKLFRTFHTTVDSSLRNAAETGDLEKIRELAESSTELSKFHAAFFTALEHFQFHVAEYLLRDHIRLNTIQIIHELRYLNDVTSTNYDRQYFLIQKLRESSSRDAEKSIDTAISSVLFKCLSARNFSEFKRFASLLEKAGILSIFQLFYRSGCIDDPRYFQELEKRFPLVDSETKAEALLYGALSRGHLVSLERAAEAVYSQSSFVSKATQSLIGKEIFHQDVSAFKILHRYGENFSFLTAKEICRSLKNAHSSVCEKSFTWLLTKVLSKNGRLTGHPLTDFSSGEAQHLIKSLPKPYVYKFLALPFNETSFDAETKKIRWNGFAIATSTNSLTSGEAKELLEIRRRVCTSQKCLENLQKIYENEDLRSLILSGTLTSTDEIKTLLKSSTVSKSQRL